MSHLTIIIRTALASALGMLSLAATLCADVDAETSLPPAVTETQSAEAIQATVSDQPALAKVSDDEELAQLDRVDAAVPESAVRANVSDAIAEVRRSRGSVLEGSLVAEVPVSTADAEREFSTALAQVATTEGIAPPGAASCSVASHFSPVPPPTDPSAQGSDLLRRTARELEIRASDCEDLRQFEESDQLRRLATQVRREARRWDERTVLTGIR